jgi:hypothetical protein
VASSARDVVAGDVDELEHALATDPLWPEWENELRRRWRPRADGSWIRRPTAAANVDLVHRNMSFDVAGWWAGAPCPIQYVLATLHPQAVVHLHRQALAERSAAHRRTSVVEMEGPHDLPLRRAAEVARLVLDFEATTTL